MRAEVLRWGIVGLAAFAPVTAQAQSARGQWQAESRIEALISRTTALHGALGVNMIAGTYLRLAVLGGAGARKVGDQWRASGRADVVGRFHVDPNRQFARGLYITGGATLLLDDGVEGRVRALVGAGVESRAHGNWIWGAEAGVGGGARVAVTVRRARDGAR